MSEQTSALKIVRAIVLGDNKHYTFAVGQIAGERWIGFARGREPGESGLGLFVLPEISEGCQLGIRSLRQAILMVGAIAQDPEHGYGGVERWMVAERLRGRPEDFRCETCGTVCCSGDCGEDYGEEGP
jgi:hypothetical protein